MLYAEASSNSNIMGVPV